jgi:hypothetical protein
MAKGGRDVSKGAGKGVGDGRSTQGDINAFLGKVQTMRSAPKPGERGRLIFAMDATASRDPSWDQACHIQGEMFSETKSLGGLEIQLAYYRGFGEFHASSWTGQADVLLREMTRVHCLGGRTQIAKLLKHAITETKKQRVQALVFVGDALEEDIDEVCYVAGELGMLNVPVFCFHEGGEISTRRGFEQVAKLTKGAYCPFDANSAQQLKDLLSAVAVYAAGGRRALENYSKDRGGVTLQLTNQMKR